MEDNDADEEDGSKRRSVQDVIKDFKRKQKMKQGVVDHEEEKKGPVSHLHRTKAQTLAAARKSKAKENDDDELITVSIRQS